MQRYLYMDEISASISQVVDDPFDGLAYTLAASVAQLDALKATRPSGSMVSTADISQLFGLGDNAKIETSSVAFTSDMQKSVTKQLMETYQATSRPVVWRGSVDASSAVNVEQRSVAILLR